MERNRLYQSGSSGLTAEEEAYQYVLRQIREGAYQPGDRLKSEEIASEVGVSRMPVREAFRRLAAEGLLILKANRGATVCALSLSDIEEIFEMRAVLEGLAVRLGTPSIDQRALDELEGLLDRMERSRHREDGEWLAYHRQFHEYVCGIAARPRLLRQIKGLHTALEPYVRVWFINTDTPVGESAQREHREIIEAMKSGDPERAEAAMKKHVRMTAPDLAKYI